jgi:uncharacterized protein (DUF58 family)
MSLRSLELRARTVVEGFWHGLHRSPFHGFSVEFTEYRDYSVGDDPRSIDWKVYARSDRHVIKKFEDETNVRCHLLVDQSRSMDFGTVGYTKAAYAATLAATLARFLHQQGDAVGLLSFDEEVREYLPARNRPGQLRQVMVALERPAAGRGTNLERPLERIASLVRRRGLMVLISDFLAPVAELEHRLTALAAGGHEVEIFQIRDPAERALGVESPALLEDAETGRTLYVDPAVVRAAYEQRRRAHDAALAEMCRRMGVGRMELETNQPLEFALLDFVQQRQRRGRLVRRTTSGGVVA